MLAPDSRVVGIASVAGLPPDRRVAVFFMAGARAEYLCERVVLLSSRPLSLPLRLPLGLFCCASGMSDPQRANSDNFDVLNTVDYHLVI